MLDLALQPHVRVPNHSTGGADVARVSAPPNQRASERTSNVRFGSVVAVSGGKRTYANVG
jgi:hypothetical protein